MPLRLPLTPEQRRAAATTASKAFIVAAPGTGKTTVAAERFGVARYSMGSAGRVVGVSFTRAARHELSDRVHRRWGVSATAWPHQVVTFDALHEQIVRHLLVTGRLRWPGGHVDLKVLDTWRGQANARYLVPGNQFRRVATVTNAGEVASRSAAIVRPDYCIGAKASFERHLADGVCTHQEIRAVLSGVLGRDRLRPSVGELLRATTGALIVDEIFDANQLDLAVLMLADEAGIPITLIGDPWQAVYEFRGAEPELVPTLVTGYGYETFPVTASFRFETHETRTLARALRAGEPVQLAPGDAGDVDVLLATRWEILWDADDRVLPLSFGRIDNQTDAAIVLLLDQVVSNHFGRNAIFATEAATILGLDPEVLRNDGPTALRPVLETLGTPSSSTGTGLQQLRAALRDLGSPRQLRTLRNSAEACQAARLEALRRRLAYARPVPGMTVHQAKGQEWPLVGVRLTAPQQERLAHGLKETEANDRMLYVACTRGRHSTRLVG